MKKTKIEWCDTTWNPVTGCRHGCRYCYARRMASRFASKDPEAIIETVNTNNLHILEKPYEYKGKIEPYPYGFQPTFHKYKLVEPERTKVGKRIFVGSMTDLFGEWVPDEWIQEVFAACDRAPWHTYMFLTKNPNRYIELAKKNLLPRQHWYGYSATKQDQLWHFHHADDCPCLNLFISMEPLLEDISPSFSTHMPADWVILGAETGNRRGKVVPEKNWIRGIANSCELSDIPVFMKESLLPIMGESEMKREFPAGLQKEVDE